MIKGTCFCESVTFEINIDTVEAYHCHCSICRKVTGSKFNTAFTTDFKNFKWTSSTHSIKKYQKNGKAYSHHFCSDCGCTVPNAYKENTQFWVPVGLLEDSEHIKVVKHIFVDSKANWTEIKDDLPQHSEY